MNTVPTRAPLWWDTQVPPLQVPRKAYKLGTKQNKKEGKKTQKTFPRFPLAGNTTSPKSQVLLSHFPSSVTGPGPPRCCRRVVRGARASRASNVSKPGGLSNHSLKRSWFPEAWDENLPPRQHWSCSTPQKMQLLFTST